MAEQNLGTLQCITIKESKKCVSLGESKDPFSDWN